MIEIRSLKKSDNRSGFTCGNLELDYFFQKFAGQNQYKHYIGVTYVAVLKEKIIGFISVNSSSLQNKNFAKLPNYPLPVLNLARIAVDKNFQNLGVGKKLLKFALLLSLEQKNRFGCIGVTVDIKEESIDFYKKYGFFELERKEPTRYKNTTLMFLDMKTIEKAVYHKNSPLT